jgi:hypothetical protein
MSQLTFKFSVNANGFFSYQPFTHPTTGTTTPNWPFSADDNLEFHCDQGPFTLRLRRTDVAPGAGNPPDIFNSPVTAKKVGTTWVAPVPTIVDGLTTQERKTIFHANQFIAKYRYVIGVLNGDRVDVDDNQAGIHTC